MIRLISIYSLCTVLLLVTACSKRDRSDPSAEEWADIQALSDNAVAGPVEKKENSLTAEPVSDGEFDGYVQRLRQMKAVHRNSGETLLTGKTLIFDYDKHFVRMDENVVVVDDQGTLKTESLIGHFSISNEVEYIEAEGGVAIASDGRDARAESAVYTYLNGGVQLQGLATVSEGENRLSGECIRFWMKGDRKMICEPNALLQISGVSSNVIGTGSSTDLDTEIRADRVVYDESKGLAELEGNVRLRDPRVAMNCTKVRLFLKDDNKIDWIEAVSGVIIQTGERKALAEKANYHADEGKFILEGEPKVMQGRNVMTGDRISFWQATQRMVCEPNARVLLYLDEETKAKFMKDLND